MKALTQSPQRVQRTQRQPGPLVAEVADTSTSFGLIIGEIIGFSCGGWTDFRGDYGSVGNAVSVAATGQGNGSSKILRTALPNSDSLNSSLTLPRIVFAALHSRLRAPGLAACCPPRPRHTLSRPPRPSSPLLPSAAFHLSPRRIALRGDGQGGPCTIDRSALTKFLPPSLHFKLDIWIGQVLPGLKNALLCRQRAMRSRK
jgi:hypothetical protein